MSQEKLAKAEQAPYIPGLKLLGFTGQSIMTIEDDNTLMAEQIGCQRQEIDELKRQLKTKQHHIYKMGYKIWWEKLWISFAIAIGTLFFCSIVGGLLYMRFITDPTPTHCYINNDGDRYRLIGAIPWHMDTLYGRFCSMEDAVFAAEQLQCTIKSER